MSPQAHRRIREDLELMDRFSRTYRRQFASLIEDLNSPQASAQSASQTAGRGLRLCVEAVGMLLSLQEQLAETLRTLSEDQTEGDRLRSTVPRDRRTCRQAA
jgi:hypothetical protein